MTWPSVVENIVILAVMAFLVWWTESAWWALMLLLCNIPRSSKPWTGHD